MRYVASSLLLAWFTLSVSLPLHAASADPAKDPGANRAVSGAVPAEDTEAQKAFGIREETPNQRRIRLGQPIVESFPAPEYGELLETPNQRRARLNKPLEVDAQTASIKN